ncbi:MAG: helix-hairpin-helix domain-containing protein [Syntrophobacteraceae bacterium]
MTDYQEAIQNPRLCFDDPELRSGTPVLDSLGLPKPITGGFATVYQMNCSGHRHAVRCFLRYHPDQERRYSIISDYLERSQLPCMVNFSFLKQGIKVRGKWHPILKMEWMEADPLNVYIEKNLNNPQVLLDLAQEFSKLLSMLKQHSIAHGDLQHGNILIFNGEIRLIDYDGMYVPGLDGVLSLELGHRNYQHPCRSEHDFGPYLDGFSAWVIFVSLVALSVYPDLWSRFSGGDEHLLFNSEDFKDPSTSGLFTILGNSNDPKIKSVSSLLESMTYCSDLRQLLSLDGTQVPEFTKTVPISGLSGWITDHIPPKSAGESKEQEGFSTETGASWLFDHIEHASPANFSGSLLMDRFFFASFALVSLFLAFSTGIGVLAPIIAMATIGGESIITLIALILRYRRTVETPQKRELARKERQLTRDIRKAEEQVKKLAASKTKIDKKESQELKSLTSKSAEFSQKEKDEISKIDGKLQGALSKIRSELQPIRNAESKEIDDLLTKLQKEFLTTQLRRHDLSNASIQGIGAKMKDRLLAAGIRTAADIIQVKLQSSHYGRYTNQFAMIEVLGKGWSHIEGIGPQKASALLSWRQSFESRYRANAPRSVPQNQQAAIRAKYQNQILVLESKADAAKQTLQLDKNTVHQKYQKELDAIRRQEEAIRLTYTKQREEMEKSVQDQKWQLSRSNWELGSIQHKLKHFQRITFSRYLRRIVFCG